MAYSGLLCYDLSLLIWYNIYPHSKKKKLKKMFKKKGEGGRKKTRLIHKLHYFLTKRNIKFCLSMQSFLLCFYIDFSSPCLRREGPRESHIVVGHPQAPSHLRRQISTVLGCGTVRPCYGSNRTMWRFPQYFYAT